MQALKDDLKIYTDMADMIREAAEGAEVHCVNVEQFMLAHKAAQNLGRLDLEIKLDIADILKEALTEGGLSLVKVANTRDNMGKAPYLVLLLQLSKMGYVLQKKGEQNIA